MVLLLFLSYLSAQEQPIETIYFKFDKFTLDNNQTQTVIDFLKNIDTAKVAAIQIYGYCDDRGTNDYNVKLSKKRVITVQNILIKNGFNENKIVVIEGKGRIIPEKDKTKNLSDVRSKNRRVDLFIVKKTSFGNGIYNSFQEKHKVGDRIYLENVLFSLGSSVLTEQSKKELDMIVLLLQEQKTLEFEIRGHVCCTPSYFQDAIDKKTRDRKLSLNRAKTVYRYLLNKGVSSLRMHYLGSGNKFPLGQGAAMDRRVEFLILKI